MSHPSLSSTREFAKTFSDIVFNLICNVVWDRFFFFLVLRISTKILSDGMTTKKHFKKFIKLFCYMKGLIHPKTLILSYLI